MLRSLLITSSNVKSLGDKLVLDVAGRFGPLTSVDIASVSFDGWRTKSIYIPPSADSPSWTLLQTTADTMASVDNVQVVPGNQTNGADQPFFSRGCEEGTPFSGEPVAEAVDNTRFNFFQKVNFLLKAVSSILAETLFKQQTLNLEIR